MLEVAPGPAPLEVGDEAVVTPVLTLPKAAETAPVKPLPPLAIPSTETKPAVTLAAPATPPAEVTTEPADPVELVRELPNLSAATIEGKLYPHESK